MEFKHIPIMLNEIISGLNINPDGVYVDCTIGGGGHSGEILKNLSNNGCLYGIDKDIDVPVLWLYAAAVSEYAYADFHR